MKLNYNEVEMKLTTDLKEVIGNNFKLKQVKEVGEYLKNESTGKREKTGRVLGYTYVVNCSDVGETVNVKILGNRQVDKDLELSRLGIPVEFEGLDYKIWLSTDNNFTSYNLSLSAESIKVINEKQALPKI